MRILTIEVPPSLQVETGEDSYDSLLARPCKIPPGNPIDLIRLVALCLGASLGRIPDHPNAIYSYNQDIENVAPAFALSAITGSPFVVLYHQLNKGSFEPFSVGFQSRRSRGFSLPGAMWRSIVPALNGFFLRRCDGRLALSESVMDEVRRAGLGECTVVNNGVDLERFRPQNVPKTYDAAFLGRISHQKGIDVLLRAWKIVVSQRANARLALIGGGDARDLSLYSRMSVQLGLQNNVSFLGFLSDEDVVASLNSSKLFVFPSRKEGFAQAVSQAMGCGICCVLSDLPTLREIYGPAAVMVKGDDPIDWANTVVQLLSDEQRRNEVASKARLHVSRFSWDESASRELEVITRCARE